MLGVGAVHALVEQDLPTTLGQRENLQTQRRAIKMEQLSTVATIHSSNHSHLYLCVRNHPQDRGTPPYLLIFFSHFVYAAREIAASRHSERINAG